jgi:hypothetical protein
MEGNWEIKDESDVDGEDGNWLDSDSGLVSDWDLESEVPIRARPIKINLNFDRLFVKYRNQKSECDR